MLHVGGGGRFTLAGNPDGPPFEMVRHDWYRQVTGPNNAVRSASLASADLDNPALAARRTSCAACLAPPPEVEEQPSVKTVRAAILFFQQASRGAGKSSGRTADKAIIPAVTDKPLPVYFLKEADLKEQMVQRCR